MLHAANIEKTGQSEIHTMNRTPSPSPSGTIFTLPNDPYPSDVEQFAAPLPATHLTDSIHIEDYQDSNIAIPRLPVPDDDIYRGATGAPPDRPPSPMLSVYAQSSVSSVSSGGRGRRRGTLAAVVEAAIARWGRSSSDGSSSSSSSSSSSTSSTLSHSRRRSRNRKGSVTTNQTAATKTAAERAKAREEIKVTKRVPREFVLFLPQSLCPADGMTSKPNVRPAPKPLDQPVASESQRTLRTRHVKLIVAQLEAALKKSARQIRVADKQKSRAQASSQSVQPASQYGGMPTAPAGLGTRKIPRLVVEVPTPPGQTPRPEPVELEESGRMIEADEKPKSALGLTEGPTGLQIPLRPGVGTIQPVVSRSGHQAWWLDVACPTWEDMRLLGKVRNLRHGTCKILSLLLASSFTPADVGGYLT